MRMRSPRSSFTLSLVQRSVVVSQRAASADRDGRFPVASPYQSGAAAVDGVLALNIRQRFFSIPQRDGVTWLPVIMTTAPKDFSSEEAVKLSGVPLPRLKDWDREGFLPASVPAKRRGISRR